MTQYAIVTDLNRCVGCLACAVACKVANNVPIGSFWNKVLRIGPNPSTEGSDFPNVDMYFLPIQCQHCENPACVAVCPTGASHKLEDGTVQVDKEKCIGCQFCAMSCPYGVPEGVVNLEHQWWYPEITEPGRGFQFSAVNQLISPDDGDPLCGSSNLRAYMVNVYKATAENSPYGNPCPCLEDGTEIIHDASDARLKEWLPQYDGRSE